MTQITMPNWARPPEEGAFATDRGWEVNNGKRVILLTSHRGLKEKVDALLKMKGVAAEDVQPIIKPRKRPSVAEPIDIQLPNVEDVLKPSGEPGDDVLPEPQTVDQQTQIKPQVHKRPVKVMKRK